MILQEKIIFGGRKILAACDGNCKKAWGINSRPMNEETEEFLADDELGTAPDDPGTYEGGYGKPESISFFPNKWCVRECERCKFFKIGEEIKLRDLNKRFK